MFNKDIKSLTEFCQIQSGEMYLNQIKGDVNVKIYYRPDFYPCWTPWHEFDICADDVGLNKKSGYRMQIGLGEPSPNPVEAANNRPLKLGYFFQFRVVITGACQFMGLRVKAYSQPDPALTPVEESGKPCQLIDCIDIDDFHFSNLQG